MKTPSFLLAAFGAFTTISAQTLCAQFGYYSSSGYEFNNNMWGKSSGTGSQCTYVKSVNGNGASFQTQWNWAGGANNVKSYPYAGLIISAPKLVSQIGSIPTSASWSISNSNVRADVAYDVFTARDPNHSKRGGDYELMIWLGRYGDINPIGSSVARVNVGGYAWNLWAGYNGSMRVYSFVAASPVTNFSSNLMQFFTYLASSQGFPASQQHLITLQFGTEPFTGGKTTFSVNHFSARVQ
ncbi:hypothetical protein WAI453_003070 [Rhynchosporium graminicola]